MGGIVAIDYGLKRSGIAFSDESKIFAFGLTALETHKLKDYLVNYCKENKVEKIVIGLPLDLKGALNEIEVPIQKFIRTIENELSGIEIIRIDERFTSKMAELSIRESVNKKKDRQNKFMVDEVSATLILQAYLDKL